MITSKKLKFLYKKKHEVVDKILKRINVENIATSDMTKVGSKTSEFQQIRGYYEL